MCFLCLTNRQAALFVDTLFIMAAICISIELYEILQLSTESLRNLTFAQFDVYFACICANYRLGAPVLTFPLTFAVKLC